VSTVDGIQQRTAESILAETGIDMTQFRKRPANRISV
jgi:hypothetical protein